VGTAAAVKKTAMEFRGLAADSREIEPGFLFAALKGAKTDGARFIEDAVRRGAVAVLGAPDLAGQAGKFGVRFIGDPNPRLRLARMAAEFYGAQPKWVAAVTGTNGKTSVAHFLRQIWSSQGRKAASVGTLGVYSPAGHVQLNHTTPDPVGLHAQLARLKQEGVDYLALEASSHGLDQFRLDGIDVAAAGFTNITRDHLDYHQTFEGYLKAKLGLFERLVRSGGVAVVNRDADHASEFVAAAERRGLRLVTVGVQGETLKLASQSPYGRGQDLSVLYQGRVRTIALPLAGLFQASNALVAAGLALGLGDPADDVFAALAKLQGAPGRLELVAQTRSGASIYVDYAHTPDAIETVLLALRPHVKGRLHIIFGCGGDRDRGKRPLMAAAAARYADSVIVSDDNPRSEDPAAIRREILQGAPNAREVGDRAEAIGLGIAALGSDDTLVIAGKGHEESQIVGTEVRPFSDRGEAVKAALALGGSAMGSAA
jgi:UDP-N-acetylmuramoyl-L-alanyl-D-glutamate--2,6-diaminopimelate ligase